MENQIFFVIVGNDQWIISENLCYLNNLILPENMSVEYVISASDNIPQTLEAAMNESVAKYKIYLDENTFITDKNFLIKALNIFNKQPEIGMLGVRGFYKENETSKMQVKGHYVYLDNDTTTSCVKDVCEGKYNEVLDVMALDRHFMMTSIDTAWHGDNNNFNIIKSVELRHMGYRTVVLTDEKPSVLFDNGIINK